MALPKKGFVPWTPNNGKVKCTGGQYSYAELLPMVQDTVQQYRAEWPLTLRGWLYRMMTTCRWPKTWEPALEYLFLHGRRANLLPWAAVIAGRGDEARFESHGDTAQEWCTTLTNTAAILRVDLQHGQERRIVLWCEAAGFLPRLKDVATKYGCDLLTGAGFDTLSSKFEFARRCAALGNVTVLHMGDLDASGETMGELGLAADVRQFVVQMTGNDDAFFFERVGVLDQHIDDYDLVWEPYVEGGNKHPFSGDRTAQAESLLPSQVEEIVVEAIERHLDMALIEERWELQDKLRKEVADRLSKA